MKVAFKYWWLVLLAIAVLTFKFWPEQLLFLERSDPAETSSFQITDAKISPDNNDANFPQWVSEQLSLLKSGMTLTQWRISHPQETVILYNPEIKTNINIDSTWCAKTEAILDTPGEKAVRYAIFYPPLAAATLALPTEPTEENNLIDKGCTLGLIWIEKNETSDSRGNNSALQLRNAIDQRLGKGQADILLNRIDAKYLSSTGRWQEGEAVFISAFSKFPGTQRKIMALGFLPLSGLQGDGKRQLDIYYEVSREDKLSRIREALTMSNISQKEVDTFLSYFPVEGGRPSLQPDQAESVIRLVERWIKSAEKFDNTRKAAVLILADQLLAQTQDSLGTTNIETGKSYRQRLEKHGAEFREPPLEKASLYARNWVTRAREIDKDGPMGDLAFRILMDMGCGEGSMDFKNVIKQGEKYLKEDHKRKSKAEVEFMVAEAYRDIVALASGAGAYNEKQESYSEMSVEARQKAILHYRISLPLIISTPLTREAWREGWRLIAGLPPAHLRYYCVYD